MNLPLNIDPQQMLLHLFNFAILAGGLYLLLYKPVKDFMEKRSEFYATQDKETKDSLKEARKLKDKYEKKLQKCESEMEALKAENQKEIEKIRAEKIANAETEAGDIIKRARETAKREHDEVLQSISDEVKEVAIEAAEKTILKSDKDPFEEFLDLAERSLDDGEN